MLLSVFIKGSYSMLLSEWLVVLLEITRGVPIWKFSYIPITDILATKIADSDTDI